LYPGSQFFDLMKCKEQSNKFRKPYTDPSKLLHVVCGEIRTRGGGVMTLLILHSSSRQTRVMLICTVHCYVQLVHNPDWVVLGSRTGYWPTAVSLGCSRLDSINFTPIPYRSQCTVVVVRGKFFVLNSWGHW